MARGPHPSVLALGVTLALSAGLFVAGRQRVAEAESHAEAEGRAALGELGRDLQAALSAAQGRARDLGASKTLRSAVATDQKTVAEMATKELALSPGRDETMELFQVPRGGAPLSLLRQPADGPPAPTGGQPGAVLTPSGAGVLVTVAARVMPLYREEELTGLVAITLRVDASRVAERLAAVHAAAKVEGLGAPLELGRVERRGRDVALTILEGGERPVTATLTLPRPGDGGLRYGAIGAGVLGLLVAGALLLRRPAPAAGAPGFTTPDARAPSQVPPASSPPAPPGPATVAGPTARQSAAPSGRPEGGAVFATTQSGGAPGGLIAGKYRIGPPLGAGGMSEVFLGQAVGEADFERTVAIKFLLPAYLNTAVLDYFLDEARLQAKISHPNVVQIHDLGREGQSYFIVMEYVEGLDGSALLTLLQQRRERLPLREALTIGAFACEGLHAAHTATDAAGRPLGLIHRDVKPSNILIGYSGAVKVADFGIAKAEQQSHLTVPGQVKGTLAYMAPEQRTASEIDRRVDVFGMGAVLYELITGQRIDLDLAKLMDRGVQGWPHLQLPSQVRPDLPKELDDILWRALAYRAGDRYPDCRALGAALEALLVRAGTTPSQSALSQWLSARRAPQPR